MTNHLEEFTKLYSYRLSDVAKAMLANDQLSFASASPSSSLDDYKLALHNRARNLQVDWATLVEKDRRLIPYRASISLFIERYEKWKEDFGYFDFIDLIEDGIAQNLCPDVDLAVIDEFQDLSPLMADQILMWTRMIPRTIIGGDQNQAMFEFTGTSPAVFKNFPADETVALVDSHRVPDNLVKFALGIINKNKGEETFYFRGVKPGGLIREVPSLSHIVEAIKQFKDKQFMLLARDNFNLTEAVTYLRRHGIPCNASKDKTAAIAILRRKPQTITRYDIEQLISNYFPSQKSVNDDGLWRRGAKAALKTALLEGFSPVAVDDLGQWGATDTLINALKTGSLHVLKMDGQEIRYYQNIIDNWGGVHDLVRPFTFHAAKGRETDIAIILTDVTKRIHDEERTGDIEGERRNWYVATTRAKEMNIFVRKQGTYSTRIV